MAQYHSLKPWQHQHDFSNQNEQGERNRHAWIQT
jgi:hypothetical protein